MRSGPTEEFLRPRGEFDRSYVLNKAGCGNKNACIQLRMGLCDRYAKIIFSQDTQI